MMLGLGLALICLLLAAVDAQYLDVRLVDGASSNEGRVEVYYNGTWGTVCDDLWDAADAGVVCRDLGLGYTGTAVPYAGFGQGTGDIILDNVQCTGSEYNLAACPNNGPGVHNCGHDEDAGVRCSWGGTDPVYPGELFANGACGLSAMLHWMILMLALSAAVLV